MEYVPGRQAVPGTAKSLPSQYRPDEQGWGSFVPPAQVLGTRNLSHMKPSTWTEESKVCRSCTDLTLRDRRCVGNLGEGTWQTSSERAGSRRTKVAVLAGRIHATVFCRKAWKSRKCATGRVAWEWSDSAVLRTIRTWRACHTSRTVAGCRVLRVCSR